MQLIAPVRDTPAVKIDKYGYQGEQFQYPFPLSETEFLERGLDLEIADIAEEESGDLEVWIAPYGVQNRVAEPKQVHHANPVAPLQELWNQPRAYIAGSAGDQDQGFATTRQSTLLCRCRALRQGLSCQQPAD